MLMLPVITSAHRAQRHTSHLCILAVHTLHTIHIVHGPHPSVLVCISEYAAKGPKMREMSRSVAWCSHHLYQHNAISLSVTVCSNRNEALDVEKRATSTEADRGRHGLKQSCDGISNPS